MGKIDDGFTRMATTVRSCASLDHMLWVGLGDACFWWRGMEKGTTHPGWWQGVSFWWRGQSFLELQLYLSQAVPWGPLGKFLSSTCLELNLTIDFQFYKSLKAFRLFQWVDLGWPVFVYIFTHAHKVMAIFCTLSKDENHFSILRDIAQIQCQDAWLPRSLFYPKGSMARTWIMAACSQPCSLHGAR